MLNSIKKVRKTNSGITLIALVITIIVLLILAGVAIATLTGDNGLLRKAANSKQANEKGEIGEQIKLAYNDWKLRKETGETVDLQNTVQTTLDKMYDNAIVNKQGKAISINVKGHEFTLVDDGTMEEGQLAYLDIAEGTIQLYQDGYIQGTNSKVAYTGRYIITGTTIENALNVMEEGNYNITIKDLNIDNNRQISFNANKGNKTKGCVVKVIIEGNNTLKSNDTAIEFSGATPNINGETEGSSLTIQGNGKLKAQGGGMCAGIGSSFLQASNIIINGGDITALGGDGVWNGHGNGIGGGYRGSASNIIINGGNITANGIGANGLIINGGVIYSTSRHYWPALSGKIEINGGSITAVPLVDSYVYKTNIRSSDLTITGGTIKSTSSLYAGISCSKGGKINITGGNIRAIGKDYGIATYEEEGQGAQIIPYVPKNESENLYETQIKLNEVGEGKKITNIVTSDNINYGINDMYTLEEGMLYLYLPAGERTITVEVDGKTYSGTVQTTETPVEVTLNEIN